MQDDDPTVQLERLMSTGITAGMQGSTTKTPVPSTATPASQTSSPSVYANSDVNLDIDLVEGRNDWLNIQPIIRLGLNALAQKLERHLDVAAETERMVHTKAPIADLQMLASQFRALESHMDTQMDAKVDARNFERRAQETWLELEQRLEALSRDGQHALDSRVSPLENKLNTEAKLVEDMRISIVTMKTSIAEGVADASKRTAESDFQLKGEAEKLAAALRAERQDREKLSMQMDLLQNEFNSLKSEASRQTHTLAQVERGLEGQAGRVGAVERGLAEQLENAARAEREKTGQTGRLERELEAHALKTAGHLERLERDLHTHQNAATEKESSNARELTAAVAGVRDELSRRCDTLTADLAAGREDTKENLRRDISELSAELNGVRDGLGARTAALATDLAATRDDLSHQCAELGRQAAERAHRLADTEEAGTERLAQVVQELSRELENRATEAMQHVMLVDVQVIDLRRRLDDETTGLSQRLDDESSRMSQQVDKSAVELSRRLDAQGGSLVQQLEHSMDEISKRLEWETTTLSQRLEHEMVGLSARVDGEHTARMTLMEQQEKLQQGFRADIEGLERDLREVMLQLTPLATHSNDVQKLTRMVNVVEDQVKDGRATLERVVSQLEEDLTRARKQQEEVHELMFSDLQKAKTKAEQLAAAQEAARFSQEEVQRAVEEVRSQISRAHTALDQSHQKLSQLRSNQEDLQTELRRSTDASERQEGVQEEMQVAHELHEAMIRKLQTQQARTLLSSSPLPHPPMGPISSPWRVAHAEASLGLAPQKEEVHMLMHHRSLENKSRAEELQLSLQTSMRESMREGQSRAEELGAQGAVRTMAELSQSIESELAKRPTWDDMHIRLSKKADWEAVRKSLDTKSDTMQVQLSSAPLKARRHRCVRCAQADGSPHVQDVASHKLTGARMSRM
ncbi:hypothetical protein CYMTET_26570 [Cymbomonas tetramitiformis]|uniref:Uncharacterized protein n=1 Tax=Cymbomonas tetramitiformis TaxID=36881 RepID=A0AAE0KXW6_9CHLO|nr:hypothetical protein CYMTET_26570 [Cymbomonas tetramitiformis]